MREGKIESVVLIMAVLIFAEGSPPAQQNMTTGPSSGTIPALPVQSEAESCELDLSDELFGGVDEACTVVGGGSSTEIDKSRCCPVIASWLYAAHARRAMQAAPPMPSSPYLVSSSSIDLPVLPDDSQTCATTLQNALRGRGVNIPQPNSSCDAILCFCGIRVHQIGSLNCPLHARLVENSSAMALLESNCRNPSYQGCTKCLKTLHKLNGTSTDGIIAERSKMHTRDCELMGLTWLLGKNKTAYIPTVSAVLRAIMYSDHHNECSADEENMPLAVDSARLNESSAASAAASIATPSSKTATFASAVVVTATFLFTW